MITGKRKYQRILLMSHGEQYATYGMERGYLINENRQGTEQINSISNIFFPLLICGIYPTQHMKTKSLLPIIPYDRRQWEIK